MKNHVTVKANEVAKLREEYHLTPKDNNLRSQTMVLNGIPLKLTNEGDIPTMDPVQNNVISPIHIAPLSIAFIVYPNFDAPACARHSETIKSMVSIQSCEQRRCQKKSSRVVKI